MTTVFASRLDRPKKVIRYGKSGSRSSYSTKHVDTWIEDDALVSQPVASRPTVKESYTVNKRETAADAKNASLKPVKSRAIKQDAWDVPSDDEVQEDYEIRQLSAPKLKSSRKLVDDKAVQQETLAPWESRVERKKAVAVHGTVLSKAKAASPQRVEKPANTHANVTAKLSPPTPKNEPQSLSAVALLAARRKQCGNTAEWQRDHAVRRSPAPAKRAGTTENAHQPRKRARKSPAPRTTSEDVVMDMPTCALADDMASKCEPDSFDFPADDNGEPTLPSITSSTSKPAIANSRRGKLSSARRSAPPKGSSAPARLSDMLPVDTDSTDAPSPSPSGMASPPSTGAKGSTPAHSPKSQHSAPKTMTPKQAQLWSQLLPSDPPAPTPSHLAIQNLTLAGRRKPAASVAPPKLTLTKSVSDVPELHRRRTRLVDRLKADASSSDAESSDDDSDVDMEDVEEVITQETTTVPLNDEPASQQSQHKTQPQSQSQGGARVTYARARSYLQEDSLDDVLFGLQPTEMPHRPPTFQRQPSKNGVAQSQKSAFDLDDSDDEHPRGGLRTIHELRAAGRNDRFTQDTAALLEDIADHSISARARRRSALSELALKLGEKTYVERFVGKAFEHNIVAELSAPEDQIADAVLAAAFAMLSASEPQQHVIATIADAGIVDWIARMLDWNLPLAKLARERRFNMSKASQSGLAEFAGKLRMSNTLWQQTTPSVMSPRLIAMRLLDLLIGRLRKSGDRSDIVDDTHLGILVGDVESADIDPSERSLIISVLESLSTSAPSLNWPTPVLEAVASAVHHTMTITSQTAGDRHTTFLAFRLTLNLTNNNGRNCTYFSSEPLVADLILAINVGFRMINDDSVDAEARAISMDLLVLAMGIMINLAEHSENARRSSISDSALPGLRSLLDTFTAAQESLEEAESLDASQTNVAYGYLAVMLANLCMDAEVCTYIAETLPGKNLDLLVNAVEEFVRHHQRVDALGLGLEGTEGREVWGAFTEKLKAVLGRLRVVAGDEQGSSREVAGRARLGYPLSQE